MSYELIKDNTIYMLERIVYIIKDNMWHMLEFIAYVRQHEGYPNEVK